MQAPDLEALETALGDYLMTLENTAVNPHEPLVRSTFNLLDEAMRTDDTPRRLPGVGIIHQEETMERNRLLGGAVEQEGRESWHLVALCDAPGGGGGVRGKRGAYGVSKQIAEGLDGWEIAPGCPVSVDRRRRYDARDENGELIPLAGYVIEISHPCIIEE
jgi:hypothetical protein